MQSVLFQTVQDEGLPLNFSLDFYYAVMSDVVPVGTFADAAYFSIYESTNAATLRPDLGQFDSVSSIFDATFSGFTNLAPGVSIRPSTRGPDWWTVLLTNYSATHNFIAPTLEVYNFNGIANDSTAPMTDVVVSVVPEPGVAALLCLAFVFALVVRARRVRHLPVVLLALLCAAGPLRAQNVTALGSRVRVATANETSNFDRVTRVITQTADVTVTNTGDRPIKAPLRVRIALAGEGDLARVTLGDVVAGGGDDTRPFRDLSALLPSGGLAPGGSVQFSLRIVRPFDVPVSYRLEAQGVFNRDPVPAFDAPLAAVAGEEVAFDAGASDDGDGGKQVSYAWNFGDGGTSDGAAPKRTFAKPGRYDVVLTVTDGENAKAVLRKTITVLPSANFAVARTRTLDASGQPLGGVAVRQRADSDVTESSSDAATGFAALGGEPGEYVWRFSREGYLPAWRKVTLAARQILFVPSPWMVRENAEDKPVSPLRELVLGGTNQPATITFAAGAFAAEGFAGFTPIGPQALPLPLAAGWSPLGAFHLSLPAVPSQSGNVTWAPSDVLAPDDAVAMLKYDTDLLQWTVTSLSAPGVSPNGAINEAGTYALVVADKGARAPPSAQVGDALPAAMDIMVDSSAITATGSVDPSKITASHDAAVMTTSGRAVFTGAFELPSGTYFRTEIEETYNLANGRTQRTPVYDTSFFAYQRPGDADAKTLHAVFPLRPTRILSPEQIDTAKIEADILTGDSYAASLFDQTGGRIAAENLAVSAEDGDLSGRSLAELRLLELKSFEIALAGRIGVAAFQLAVGNVANGRGLDVELSGLAPNKDFVVARHVAKDEEEGLEPVERLRSNAEGLARSVEPAEGVRLPGVTGPGQYVVVAVDRPQAVVSGVARNLTGEAVAGLAVRITGLPWLTFSAAGGAYKLVAPQGAKSTVALTDPTDGNSGSVEVDIAAGALSATANVRAAVTAPRVVSVSPADGAQKVRAATPVKIRFSEPIDPAAFGSDAMTLSKQEGGFIEGTLSLNPGGIEATFLPTNPLEHAATYSIDLSPAIKDRQGLALTGSRRFSFSVAAAPDRTPGAQLVIYEPGADNVPQEIRSMLVGYNSAEGSSHVVAHGSAGTADPEVPVLLVNQNTGETATVLSKPDGSFANFINASEEDFIEAVFVNANGTRVTVPATRQLFDNGQVGLYRYGGILEAETDGTPATVTIDPGVIPTRTKFKVEMSDVEFVQKILNDAPPVDAAAVPKVMRLSMEGDPLVSKDGDGVEISFPVSEQEMSALGFAPGEDPEEYTAVLTVPTEIDGTVGYMVLDTMSFEGGKLVTHSPPFPGAELFSKPVERDSAPIMAAVRRSAQQIADYFKRNPDALTALEVGFFALDAAELAAAIAGGPGAIAAYVAFKILEKVTPIIWDYVEETPIGHALVAAGEAISARPLILNPLTATNIDISLMPLVYGLRKTPTVFSGRVIELRIDPTRGAEGIEELPDAAARALAPLGAAPVSARVLPGALVTLSDISGEGSAFSAARPGGITAGQLFTVSARNGMYAFAVPTKVGSLSTLIPGRPDNFAIRATHRRFPGQFVTEVVDSPTGTQMPRVQQDLVFVSFAGFPSVFHPTPPLLDVFHAPSLPAPGGTARLTVSSLNAFSQGLISVNVEEVAFLDEVSPGTTAPQARVVALPEELVGTAGKIQKFDVSCDAKAKVTLKVSVRAFGGETSTALYSITFGGTPPVEDGAVATDLFDKEGPRVVSMTPSDRSIGWQPGQPLRLEFNEPLGTSMRNGAQFAHLMDENQRVVGPLRLDFSPDMRSVEIFAPSLVAGSTYNLSLDPTLVWDRASNFFDQDPSTPEANTFTASVRVAPNRSADLPGIAQGGGAVSKGIYAYVLERAGPLDGSLVVYDLSDPMKPAKKAEVSLPGFPRDLRLIPQYSFVRSPGRQPETKDLIAVVGGKTGGAFDGMGNFLGAPQYLWIIDVSNPLQPRKVASRVITAAFGTIVPQVLWSAPHLAYLESSADLTSVELVNLQEFILGANMTQEQYSENPRGQQGRDINGDGDYVDDGERLPLPEMSVSKFAGHVNSFSLEDSNQRIIDYDWDSETGTLGVILTGGRQLGMTGMPTDVQLPRCYRTFVAGGTEVPSQLGSVVFDNVIPSLPPIEPARVKFFFKQDILTAEGPAVANLALVSLYPRNEDQSSLARLAVVDITNPTKPRILSYVEAPPHERAFRQILQRVDGLLVVAMQRDALLIDPRLLGLAATPGSAHPAVMGTLRNFGGGGHTIDSDPSGLNVSSLGARNVVVQTAPSVAIVALSEILPSGMKSMLASFGAQALVDSVRLRSEVFPARVIGDASSGIASDVNPPNHEHHSYVMVEAPGSAGPTIDIALESLDSSGQPLRNRGEGFAPVKAISPTGLKSLNDSELPCGVKIAPLLGHRLSDNPGDDLYNVYLSDPFILVAEGLSHATIDALRGPKNERVVLWSGSQVRASLDPSMQSNPAIGPFASIVDLSRRQLRPGPAAVAGSLPADYILGANPGPIDGHPDIPGTSGTVAALNGETRLEETDFSLPARRLPIVFTRFNNGQDLYEGIFGRGWDFNYNSRIVELSTKLTASGYKAPLVLAGNLSVIAQRSDVIFHTGAARPIRYAFAGTSPPAGYKDDPLARELGFLDDKKAATYYLPAEKGVFDMMVRMRDGKFVVLQPDGTRHWFAANGRLEKIQDRYELNYLTFVYSKRGELRRILDHSATPPRFLELGYYRASAEDVEGGSADASITAPPSPVTQAPAAAIGKVCRLRDYVGRDIYFEYDACGKMVKRYGIDIASGHGLSQDGEFQGREITLYNYVDKGKAGHSETANNLVGTTTGSETGEPLFLAKSFSSDSPAPRAESGSGELGAVETTYLRPNTALATASGQAESTTTLSDGTIIKKTFFSDGRVESVRSKGPGAPEAKTSYTYEGGLVKTVTYPEGNSVEYVRDMQNPILRSRPNVLRTIQHPGPRAFPDTPQTIETSQSGENGGYDPKYNFPSGTALDANGFQVTLEPAASGKDIGKIIRPERTSAVEEFSFNEFGQPLSSQDVDGFTTATEYDLASGFPTKRRQGHLATEYSYAGGSGFDGLLGLPTKITPPEGDPLECDYNEVGSLLSTKQGDRETTTAYDVRQRDVVSAVTVDRSGKKLTTKKAYLQNGFLKSVTVRGVETEDGVADLTTSMEEDSVFRVKKITYPGGQVRRFEDYDHLDRPARSILGVGADAYEERYAYDLNGNRTSVSKGGATDTALFDGYDRLVEAAEDTGSGMEKTVFSYFPGGQVSKATVLDRDGITVLQEDEVPARGIDSSGRVLVRNRKTETGKSTVNHEFDGKLRRHVEVSPFGERTETRFNAAGQVESISDSLRTVTMTYGGGTTLKRKQSDEVSDPSALPNVPNFFTIYTYDPSLNHPTGVQDNLGQLATLEPRLDGANEAVINAGGHRTSIGLTILGERYSLTKPNGIEFRYRYAAHRAPSAVRDKTQSGNSIGYDASFRSKSFEDRAGNNTAYKDFDLRNNLPKLIEMPGGGAITLEYDAKGRMTSRRVSFGGQPVRTETADYDSMDRVRSATFPGGSSSYTYSLLGPLLNASMQIGLNNYSTSATYREDASRLSLQYPSAGTGGISVAEGRDQAGRLTSVVPSSGEAVLKPTGLKYASADLVSEVILGDGALLRRDFYDGRKRLVARTYERSGSSKVADVRYVYDGQGNVLARQYLHRSGRTDAFGYDTGERLASAHFGARPKLAETEPRPPLGLRGLPGIFAAQFQNGFYERSYIYDNDGLDLLSSSSPVNPDALQVLPFTEAFGAGDQFLNYQTTDGFVRSTDLLGNVTRARLFVRNLQTGLPNAVNATLTYNGLNQLVQVSRDDLLTIKYEYDERGLMVKRVVERPGNPVPEEEVFVWREDLLLSIFDVTGGRNRLKARMYYNSGDSPVAADMDLGGGGLERCYFLQENNSSVMGLTRADGQLAERYVYESFGYPHIEGPDTSPPTVSKIILDNEGILIHFSERVLPLPVSVAPPALATDAHSILQAAQIGAVGGTLGGVCALAERIPGEPFGTSLRLRFGQALSGPVTLVLSADKLVDEAGNPFPGQSFNFNIPASPGVLFSAEPSSPAPAHQITRNPFLFHGQFYDHEAGLYYMRARFYDPATGGFLQRDPLQYEDSVNLYAGMAHNPLSFRDPSGNAKQLFSRVVAKAASKLGSFAARQGMSDLEWKAFTNVLGRRLDAGQEIRLSIRSVGKKAPHRRISAEQGIQAKPAAVGDKTDGEGLIKWTDEYGRERVVSTDLDALHLEINGRMATHEEAMKLFGDINRELKKLASEAGKKAAPPLQHGAHTGLPFLYSPNHDRKFISGQMLLDDNPIPGTARQGVLVDQLKYVDDKVIKAVGHPGASFTLQTSRRRGFEAYDTPKWQTHKDILTAEKILKEKQIEAGLEPIGFQGNWHKWSNAR